MTPAENKQTVEAALDRWTNGYYVQIADMPTIGRARAALRDLAAEADRAAELEAALASARKTLEVIEEPMHFDDLEAIVDDRMRMQTAARAWLTRYRALLAGDGGGAPGEDCPAGGTHARIRHAKGRCIKCGGTRNTEEGA